MSGNLMSLGNANLRPLIIYTRVAMSTITMLIRNVHGTLPPHGGILRLNKLCTYPIVIGGGHSARHMGQLACATSTMISGISPEHGIFDMLFDQFPLNIFHRGKNNRASFL